jgi:hypothetical protein
MTHDSETIILVYHECGHALATLAWPDKLHLLSGPKVDTTNAAIVGLNSVDAERIGDPPGIQIKAHFDRLKQHPTAEAKEFYVLQCIETTMPENMMLAAGILGEDFAPIEATARRYRALRGASSDLANIICGVTHFARLAYEPNDVRLTAAVRDALIRSLDRAFDFLSKHEAALNAMADELLLQSGPSLVLSASRVAEIFAATSR